MIRIICIMINNKAEVIMLPQNFSLNLSVLCSNIHTLFSLYKKHHFQCLTALLEKHDLVSKYVNLTALIECMTVYALCDMMQNTGTRIQFFHYAKNCSSLITE